MSFQRDYAEWEANAICEMRFIAHQAVEVVRLPKRLWRAGVCPQAVRRKAFPGVQHLLQREVGVQRNEDMDMVGHYHPRVLHVPAGVEMAEALGNDGRHFTVAQCARSMSRIKPALQGAAESSVILVLCRFVPRFRVVLQPCVSLFTVAFPEMRRDRIGHVERDEIGRTGLLPVGQPVSGMTNITPWIEKPGLVHRLTKIEPDAVASRKKELAAGRRGSLRGRLFPEPLEAHLQGVAAALRKTVVVGAGRAFSLGGVQRRAAGAGIFLNRWVSSTSGPSTPRRSRLLAPTKPTQSVCSLT